MDTVRVNRFELIDHTKTLREGGGRAFTKWVNENFVVQFSLQDGNRTLKIFLMPLDRDTIKEQRSLARPKVESA